MPSLTKFVSFTALLLGLGSGVDAGKHKQCQNTALSCTLPGVPSADTCCYEDPGGLVLQTQFWDYDPPTGPNDSWTVHGLWPDFCNGSYPQFCDSGREYSNITDIIENAGRKSLLSYMNKFWKDYQGEDESFWSHEWDKHGTCMSTLEPKCYNKYEPQQEVVQYFAQTVRLFKTLPSYKFLENAGIVPSSTATYKLVDVQNALKAAHGGVPSVLCDNDGSINEIWYYYYVKGPIPHGEYTPTENTYPGDCPATVKYFPKGYKPPVTTTSTTITRTTTTATSTATGAPFTGRGYLDVTQKSSNSTNGCIISYGTWYTTGTCATYTAAAASDGFTLTSSKGKCAINGTTGALGCSAGVTEGAVFASSGSTLSYSGSTSFYANAVSSGSTQQSVFPGTGAVDLTISWRGI